MRELVIGREEAHQRLDKYLQKYFENASAGFLYKMMRKKNIVRNGKKVQGKEILCEGDVIRVFFSDETFAAMRGGERALGLYEKLAELEDKDVDVIYEDADILAVNKPAGILSQKAKDTDISMNEEILIEKEGKDILIGFNPKFLIDALRVIDDEMVTLYLVNPKAPCFIRDENQTYIYLILPVNFNSASV